MPAGARTLYIVLFLSHLLRPQETTDADRASLATMKLWCVLCICLALRCAQAGIAPARPSAVLRAGSGTSLQHGAGSLIIRMNTEVYPKHEQLNNAHVRQRRSLPPPEIRSFHITSNISARFGETQMTSVVLNEEADDREIAFQVFPDINAFQAF